MKNADRQTRSHLMQLFKEHGFNPRTHLGQNFLIDINIIEFIVREGQLTSYDVVLEVGTGTGGMTMFMVEEAGYVVSVEVDQNMHQLAKSVLEGCDNVTLMNTDALRNKNHLSDEVLAEVQTRLDSMENSQLKLVANLPYSVATPVVSNLVATDLPWSRMIVTIQLELGERMAASPGTSNYGALSVWLQAQCRVKMIKRLAPSVFWPRPKVHSAVVRLSPDPERKAKIIDRPFFHDFVRRLFHHRRKLLRTVLVGMYSKQLSKPEVDELLAQFGYETETRAEELDVDQHVQLANSFYAAIKVKEDMHQG